MRGLVAIAIAGLLLLCAAGLAGAGVGKWGPPHGLYGGRITSLAIDPRNTATVYAATPYAGVFKSTDGARSWRPSNNGLGRLAWGTLAVDRHSPATMYVGVGLRFPGWAAGVFKTTDGGRSWRSASTGLGARSVSVLAVDQKTPGIVYAGTIYERVPGLFKTTNGGRSWGRIATFPGSNGIRVLEVDPHAASTLYAAVWPGGAIKSGDGGRTWHAVNVGVNEDQTAVEALAVDPVIPNTLYAGVVGLFGPEPGGVFKSTDGGASWNRASAGLGGQSVVGALEIDPRNTSILYADAEAGIFKSVDGGASWTALTKGPRRGVSEIVVDPQNSGTVYVGTRFRELATGDGVFKSVDGGRRWRTANTGLASMELRALAIHPRRAEVLYTATFEDGVFKSSDGGRSWRALRVGGRFTNTLEIAKRSPSTLYVATFDGVKRSVDSGRTWRLANGGLADTDDITRVNELAIDPRRPSTVYAGTGYGIFKTTDAGRWWRDTGIGRRYVGVLLIDPRTPTTVYAGTHSVGVLKSTNEGGDWRRVNVGLPVWDASVAALAIDPRRPATLYVALTPRFTTSTTRAGIFKSTDAGQTWRAANAGLPQGRKAAVALAIDPKSASTVYAVVNGDVFRSTNGGGTWRGFESGLGVRDIVDLEIAPTGRVLYVGARNGEVFDYRVPR